MMNQHPREGKRFSRWSKSERRNSSNSTAGGTRKRFELKRLMCSSSNNGEEETDDRDEDDWEAQHRSCWDSFQQTFNDEGGQRGSKSFPPRDDCVSNTLRGLTVRLLCRSRASHDDDEGEEGNDFVEDSQAETHYTHSSSTEDDLDDDDADDTSSSSSTHHTTTTMHSSNKRLEEAEIDDAAPQQPQVAAPRGLRFADEVGQDIETIHYTETEYSEPMRRIMILLLRPQDRRFELIQVSYVMDERTTVKDVTNQLHNYCADAVLQAQTYSGLACRRQCRGGVVRAQELLHTLCIQDYDLVQNEVLVGLVKGYSSSELMDMAQVLLEHKNVRKAARCAKKSRRAIQPLHPSSSPRSSSTRRSSNNYNKTVYPRSGGGVPMSCHEIEC